MKIALGIAGNEESGIGVVICDPIENDPCAVVSIEGIYILPKKAHVKFSQWDKVYFNLVLRICVQEISANTVYAGRVYSNAQNSVKGVKVNINQR